MIEVFIGINNVSSPQRLVDAVKATLAYNDNYGLQVKGMVVTKASGMAVQAGVPDASRVAYREGKTLILLPTLKDAIELLKPEVTILNLQEETSETIDNIKILPESRILYVTAGHEDGYSKQDLALGTLVRFKEFKTYIPPAASIALFLTQIMSRIFK